MRTALVSFLTVVLIGAIVGTVVVLVQPETTRHHPDFGQDCTVLLNDATAEAVDCVRVFYGTNRDVLLDGNAPAPDGEVDTKDVVARDGGHLHVGRADVWLPKLVEEGGTRERGETPMLKGPAPDEDDELVKYVFLTRITKAGRERFLTELDDALIDQDSWSVLLFVHGFNTGFEDALIRSAQLSVDLSRRAVFDVGVPVLFSWPSAGKLSLADYRGDQDSSLAAAPYLEDFLDLIIDNSDIDRINIVAHSMGNRLLTQALEDYAADYLERHGESDIEFRIVLVAADVDRDIFDGVTGVLDNLKANVTIYTSDADRALQASELVNKNSLRLGDTDLNRPYIRRDEFYETVDATGVATELFGLGHGYYSNNPFILGDMLCAMAEANPEQRALEQMRYGGAPDGDEYYRVSAAVEPGYEECSLFRDAFPLTDVSQAPDEGRFEPSYAPAPPPPPPEAMEDAPPMSPAPTEIVYYVEDRDAFDPDALAGELMAALEAGDVASITIRTFTDTVGSEPANITRTERWARQLSDWLVAQGVDPDMIFTNAFGESELAVDTGDETDEPLNRRIEIVVEYQ
ncbi:alpha/beta hydrolase [Henriciella aquimarina]|uniref:alpha/beta hydrolase n=1 Tax=Henriciella aquimarina TaxID=545261 RepID=UPI000A0269E2|nr:alpha/beta hydrolase [Henriciella aquimarina]